MINKKQLRNLVVRTLKKYDLHSDSAVELLLGTFAIESRSGTYLRQIPKGEFDIKKHALGLCQMEYATFSWLKLKYNGRIAPRQWQNSDFEDLEYNLELGILLARLRYLAVPRQLPRYGDIEGMASYWNQWYNANPRYGTDEEFITKYNKYCK